MPPLPYHHTGAGVAFYAVLVAFLLLEMRIRVRSNANPGGTPADRGSLVSVWLSVAGGLVAAFLLAGHVHAAAITAARWPLFVIGIVLMVAGIALRQWAVALLGPLFTVNVRVHEGQTVVERGPYRWLRHPSYTGLLMTLLGIGLALGNWAALAVLATVPTAGIVLRITVEERALGDGLGDSYRRFAATRKRLIPHVW